jgi:hypothetical protein
MRFWFSILLLIGLTACAAQPTATPIPPPTATPARPAPPVLGNFDSASVANINLDNYPIIPAIGPAAIAIYKAGIAGGNQARVFSKLGDCMTENPYFLGPFSAGQYDLGDYQSLQTVIDQFAGVSSRGEGWDNDSFATVGLASASGFNVAGPLNAMWADPKWCKGGETPLACEYRVTRSSLALLMFGTNDVTYTEPDKFDFYLRTLVDESLARDVLPLLSTFPTRPEEPEQSRVFNQIVATIADDYGLPLINLNRALKDLPHEGVDPNDTIHLSVPPDKRVDVFSPETLQYGFTVRNLVTLQALEAVLTAVSGK